MGTLLCAPVCDTTFSAVCFMEQMPKNDRTTRGCCDSSFVDIK